MLYEFDLESLVDFTAKVYTRQEIHHKIQKEQRSCFCFDDARHRKRFGDDTAVTWQAFLFYRDIREGRGLLGVYARGERDCGMVQFWDEDWMLHPASDNFWSYLFRRAEKQCGSLSDWKNYPLSPKKTEQERIKHTSSAPRKRLKFDHRSRHRRA